MLAMDCISNKRAIIMTLLEKLKLFKEGMNDESCVLAGRFETTIDEIISTLEAQEEYRKTTSWEVHVRDEYIDVLKAKIARQEKLLGEAQIYAGHHYDCTFLEVNDECVCGFNEWLAARSELEGEK